LSTENLSVFDGDPPRQDRAGSRRERSR